MMNKMSSITFPDGSQYEVTDDKARKDITEINNDIDNVQGAIDELKGTIGYTRKNLLVYPYHNTPVNFTNGGITWTVNSDTSVTASGTATLACNYYLTHRNYENGATTLPAGTYILSGCPKNGSDSTYNMTLGITGSDGNYELIGREYGEGLTFTLEKETRVGIACVIETGHKANNVTFKPMIRLASIEDDTYEPYVEDVDTRLGNLICKNLPKTLNEDRVPYKELKAQWSSFPNGRVFTGMICGVFSYTGHKNYNNYGSFLVHSYDLNALYHVTNNNGIWSYKSLGGGTYTTF